MKNKSIIFMGTPEFAVASLKLLVHEKYNVIGVITSIDKKRGRGQKKSFSPVKKFAKNKELNIYQPKNLKDQNFIKLIKKINPDLFVVVAFRMLPEILINIPKYGCINLHSSILPNYRGAAPINWVLIHGEKETGVTTFFINKKIDEGDIINIKKVDIQKNDTAGSLHDKLMIIGSKLVDKSIKDIFKGKFKRIKQKLSGEENTAPKITKEICLINLDSSSIEINNLIRGLTPYPGAKLFQNNKQYKILKASITENIEKKKSGLFIYEKKIILNNNLGESLEILELQEEGKKNMKSSDYLRGNKL